MTRVMEPSPLKKLLNLLRNDKEEFRGKYLVPSLWAPVGQEPIDGASPLEVNPRKFFKRHIEVIDSMRSGDIDPTRSLNVQPPKGDGGEWLAGECIFNLFVRHSCAFDHNGDGILGGSSVDCTLNSAGVRETGTFLKAISLLGYIKSLGATTIHLLPVTSIGRDSNKGALGSPYAIRNPYALEVSQADPLVQLSVEEQFGAFVEACHILKMRVIAEFVFRTASKGSDWIKENPEWFYWINAEISDRKAGCGSADEPHTEYGNPIFSRSELELINEKVTSGDFNTLPAPPESYRKFFKLPPAKAKTWTDQDGRIIGEGIDPDTGSSVNVRIPGAFADWPPDDTQPPWGDVTYLKMYLDENPYQPRFNYIAYNTIRMYDTALAQESLVNRPLWDKIRDLIPYYQDNYGIDGVMVDMGHAVPVKLMQEIVDAARAKDPDFGFLSENFSIDQTSVDAGYNAVVGYAWWVEYKRDGLTGLLDHVGRRGVPLAFLGAVENHNTPRAASRPGGEKYSRYAFLVNTMLPRSIPFIHSGFELGETLPVNTGLDFSPEVLEQFSGKPLPLFDPAAHNWTGSHPMLSFTRKVLHLRKQFHAAVSLFNPESFISLQTGNPDLVAFLRRGGGQTVMVLLNRNLEESLDATIDLRGFSPVNLASLKDLISADENRPVEFPLEEGILKCCINPGDSFFFAW